MKRIFSPKQSDNLIVALLVHDLIEAVNQAMRVRKIMLTLDYTHKDHRLRVYVSMPDTPREVWLLTNTRTRVCSTCRMLNPHLQLFANDLRERLKKLGASIALVGGRRQRSAPEAKIQICVEGSESTALTLARVPSGKAIDCYHFTVPGGAVS